MSVRKKEIKSVTAGLVRNFLAGFAVGGRPFTRRGPVSRGHLSLQTPNPSGPLCS